MENEKQSVEPTKLEKFVAEYGELVKKHNVDFISYPVFVPSENGEFKVRVVTQPVSTDQNKTVKDFISND